MNADQMVTTFFVDQDDYLKFLVILKEKVHTNNDGSIFASLTKEDDCFLYTLTHYPSEMFIGDYVKPFRASKENVDLFNRGCRILAERLQIYLETNDEESVSSIPPAFGILTHYKQDL